MKNLKYKLQIISEGLSEINQSFDSKGLEYSLIEYVEDQAKNEPNFFRWLFSEDFDDDFDTNLTNEQREEYNNFLNSLSDNNLIKTKNGANGFQFSVSANKGNTRLEELKQWCIDNADHQSGMDDDGGFYESMDFLKIEEIVEKIDEMLKD